MNVTLDFRSDKPSESGDYLIAVWGERDTPYYVSTCYYNADTGRWNDYDGTGEDSFNVDMWADFKDVMRKGKKND